METTFERNKQILKDVLSGIDAQTCAEKYNIAKTGVGTAMRAVLSSMQEHTDYDLEVSIAVDFLSVNKATILKYIDEPMPKVSLTRYTKEVLIKEFGPFYAKIPGQVAAEWSRIQKHFSYYPNQRDKRSVQRWLASEGYLVGDHISDDMREYINEVLKKTLLQINDTNGEYSFAVEKTSDFGDNFNI